MTDTIKYATGPVTWGVDFADTPTNPSYTQVLDEIAQSGIGALELGPVGYLPEKPAILRRELSQRGLTAVGSFVFEDLHDPRQRQAIEATTRRACAAIRAARGTVLVIIDRPSEPRIATAGQTRRAARLEPAAWAAMLDTTRAVAAIAEEHGLRPAFHPHAGGYVEFADEIERLLADTDLGLCLDTGHMAYAGMVAHDGLRTYGRRITHLHLKDIRADVLAHVEAERLGFWDALAAGIFCPLGAGVVDLPACLGILEEIGYAGYATIEQDRVPGSGAPLADLQESLRVVRAAQAAVSAR
ncbi:MAG: inosose dehydratase [Conexibacter sp.]|nr:inosose dehydratase [Conexibacter sp.]